MTEPNLTEILTGIAETGGRTEAKIDATNTNVEWIRESLVKQIARIDELERGHTDVTATLEQSRKERREAEERLGRRLKWATGLLVTVAGGSPTLTHVLRNAGLI